MLEENTYSHQVEASARTVMPSIIVNIYSNLFLDGLEVFYSDRFLQSPAHQILRNHPAFKRECTSAASAVTHTTFGTMAMKIHLDATSIMEILYDYDFKLVNMSTVERRNDIYNVHYILVKEESANVPPNNGVPPLADAIRGPVDNI